MNYFTHAVRYLDRPYFTAGVCVPDWLNVVDRKCRVRGKRIDLVMPNLGVDERELAVGIQKHLDDDRWFHGTEAFYRVTAEIAGSFRTTLDESEGWRCGFLGHIVMELLLDAALIEVDPTRLDRFYEVLDEVDKRLIQNTVSAVATKPTDDLARMIELFIRERFLEDYLIDERLLYRLNQVMRRLELNPLPGAVLETLAFGRDIVRRHMIFLLPQEYFPEREVLTEVKPMNANSIPQR